jgi:polyisoprenoid-binding protein YceI
MRNLEHWEIDPEQSRFRFSLRHIVVQHIQGGFGRWGGALILDRDDPSRSKVHLWVDLRSIETGDAERDDHVRSAEFLDVSRFPRAEFDSTEVAGRPGGTATLSGWLDLHGRVRKVDVELQTGQTWRDADGQTHALYVAHSRIDRQDFGLHWNQDLDVGGVVVGDVVDVSVELELVHLPDRVTSLDAASASDPRQ